MTRKRILDGLFLIAATALGAWLRLRQLAVPSFWFDEIFHYHVASRAAAQPWWRWLTIFEIENGPLFYAGQLLGRFSHSPEFSARIAPALCGIATIPLLWLVARAIDAHSSIPYAAAILIAVSPLDIYYSREARPYALVVMVTAALILALLQVPLASAAGGGTASSSEVATMAAEGGGPTMAEGGSSTVAGGGGGPTMAGEGGGTVAAFAALLIVSLYSGAMMAPVIASIVIAAAIAAFRRRRWWIIAALSAACALLLVICYRPGSYPRQMSVPSVSGAELRGVFDSFSVVAVDASRAHRGALAFAALALIGAIALWRRNRETAIVIVGVGALPVAIGVTATWLLHRPYGVRYVIGGLPGYLLLVAAGIAAIASLARRWRVDIVAAILVAALLAREGWDAAMNEPFQKLDWRAVARAIARHARDNDTVIAADTWTYEQVKFYLPPKFHLVNAGRSRTLGEIFAYQHTTSWLVVGDASSEFAQWACRFPVMLASPLQQFRLHYCPNAYYFLTDRSIRAEARALLASFAGAPSLSFGPADDVLLGDGWSGPEREGDHFARWAAGRQAFIALPAEHAGAGSITIDVVPITPGRQTMAVNLNNAPIGGVVLDPKRKRYTFGGAFRAGINILRFDFDRTVAPADLDPRSSDRRPLAARFYGLAVGEGFSPPPPSHPLRLDEGDTYLDETSAWRVSGGRELPPNVDRAKLARFLGRLGFDPERAARALTTKRVTLANLAATIADDSACTDDSQFLRALFRALLGREIGTRELSALSRELQSGVSRSQMAWRLGNSDEVRRQIER